MDPYHTPMPMLANPLGPAVHTQSANRTLYVGNLDKDIDRQKLFEHFANANRTDCIENVIIKKDISGESRGFAFITFTNPADALRAKTVFNHSKIKDNQITVSFMRQPQDLDPNANLFFRNLHSNVTAKDLEELCAPYGSIVCCRLKFDSAGHPLGYGYVQFEKEQSATECLEAVKGRMLQEKAIGVEKFVPRTRRGGVSQKCNVYVKDFPASWSEKQVVDFIANDFGKYGKITSKAIAKDNKIGKHYAFVAFDKPEEARSAIEGLNGHVFTGEDSKLYVDFAQSKEQRRKILREKHLHTKNETNLFIKSLMLDVTEEKLKKAFEKYGPVTSVCVRTHELSKPAAPGGDKKSLKFGFVNFGTTEAAQNALSEGKKDPVIKALIDPSHYQQSEFLCLAQPKSVRSQYLKMTLKAKKSTQLLQRQQKAWEAVLQQFARSMNPKGMGKKQPYDVQGKRGAEYANPAGINPMMLMQGFNPQLMAGQMPFGNPAMPNQMMMMNPSLMGMTSIPGMVPQANVLLAQQQAAAAQEQMRAAAAANVKDVRWLKANLAEFESYPHDEKKNLLGNMMYNKVKELKPPNDLIPKITGMLIDLEVLSIAEIIELLESKDLLQERMNEAIKIIEEDGEN